MMIQTLIPKVEREIILFEKRAFKRSELSESEVRQIWQHQKRYSGHTKRALEWEKWELHHGESPRSSLSINKIGLYTDFT